MTAPDDKRLVPRQECLKSPYEETNAFKSGDIINSKEDLRRMARESRDRAIASITGKAPDVNDVRARFEVELAKLPAGAQANIRDAMSRDESLSFNMFAAGYRAAHADLSGKQP